MKKENILFAIIGVLLGFVVGFFTANQINRSAGQTSAPTSAAVPSGQPGAPSTDSLNHGSIQNNGGMLNDVQEKIDRAKNEPDNYEAQIAAGEMYARIGRFDRALEYFQKAYNLKPDEYRSLVILGNVNFDLDKFEESEKWYLKALEKNPDDIAVRTNLGLTFYLRQKPDYDRAIKEYNTSLSKDPNHEKTLQNLAAAQKAKGEQAAFEQTMARLQKVNPQNQAIPILRGEKQPEPQNPTQ